MLHRKSRKRDRILELLKSTDKHPSADWIYDKLKREFPELSIATVYRNLNFLFEEGLIKKIDSGSSFDRFEANADQHYHFTCKQCGKIIDLPVPVDNTLHEIVNSNTSNIAHSHTIDFFGLCEECNKK